MAGRRPKPLAIHQLNGNPRKWGKDKLEGVDNPQPDLREPEMPKGMPKAARREWRRIVPQLLEMKVLTEVDGLALAAYCRAHALVEQAAKEIEKNGMTFTEVFEGKNGEPIVGSIKANPACSIYLNAMKTMKSFLIEFGLTPASRRNIKIEKKDDGDLMEKFMNRPKSAPLKFEVKPEEMTSGDESSEG
jgi:P27 family predicted phage terminase small subunit